MKSSTPMLLAFLVPFAVAANAFAEEPTSAPVEPAPPAPLVAPAPAASYMVMRAPPSPLLERRSEAMRTAGIVLIPIAGAAIVGGGFVTMLGAFGGPESSTDTHGPATATMVALTVMGLGALTLTGGIAMAVVGSKKVPAHAEVLATAARPTVEPQVGLGSAGVKIRF
jgi:hypothetical protein